MCIFFSGFFEIKDPMAFCKDNDERVNNNKMRGLTNENSDIASSPNSLVMIIFVNKDIIFASPPMRITCNIMIN